MECWVRTNVSVLWWFLRMSSSYSYAISRLSSQICFKWNIERILLGKTYINCSLASRSAAPQLILILVTNRLWSSLESSQETKPVVQLIPVNLIKISFYVTLGDRYTYFEKLILPFDSTTWMLLIISFITGYFTIFIIYLCPKFCQHFVFGTRVRDPSLNLAQIFFGIGMVEILQDSYSWNFVIFCLIIRTA